MANWSRIASRVRVPLSFAFAVLYLALARPTWLSLLLGGLVALAGLGLRALASGHVRKNTELTTTGPYAYTRNPLYLGSMILAAGFAVAARNPWVVVLLGLLFLAIYLPVVHAEEAYLRSRFPEYADYARRVPRFGICLGTAGVTGGRFSRELYLKHREYNAMVGTVLMVAALVAKLLWAAR